MPLTFPSHAAAVLPLKLWRPRRFDGVALVLGSTSPDLLYPFAAIVPYPPTHSLPALVWWCLPATVLLTWVIRRATPTVAAHLPAGGRLGALALPDYGALSRARHRWYVTGYSALLGAVSHLCWDGFTHSTDTNGWDGPWRPWLDAVAFGGMPWFRVLQHVSSLVGFAVVLVLAVRIGRRRLIRRWYGPPPAVGRRPRLFWGVAAAVLAIYPVTWPVLTHLYQAHVQGTRLLCLAALGLLAGAAAVRLADRPRGGSVEGEPDHHADDHDQQNDPDELRAAP